MSQQTQCFYEFGDYCIEAEERLLRREDKVVPLPPKAIDVLLVLLRSNGHIITKEDLMAQVWADTFVEEANLSHNVFLLRKALGESKNGVKFIETIPRRGYRFAASVSQTAAEANGFFAREQMLSRIVVEEEIEFDDALHGRPSASSQYVELPKTATSPVIHRRIRSRAILRASLVAVVVLASAFAGAWLVRSRQAQTENDTSANLSPMKVVPLTSFPNDEFDSALSPDGKYTAFSWSGKEGERIELYVKQTDAGEPLKLTKNAIRTREGSPAWSPDGRFIAFTRLSVDLSKSGLYVVPAFGGSERRLLKAESIGPGVGWSSDGRTLVFSSKESASDPFSLYLLDFDTLETRRLTSPPGQGEGDVRPDFAPDGQTVSFTRQLQEAGDLYLSNLSGETSRLTNDNRSIIGAAWTPDGRSIVFSSNRSGTFSLWRLDTSNPAKMEPVPINAEKAFDPSISRTGNRLTFTTIQRDTNIWRVAIDNPAQAPTQIVGSTRRELTPNYSPDGTRIAYVSDISGNYEIWNSDADGSGAIQLTKFGGGWTLNPRWSPDGKKIGFDARPEGRSDIYGISSDGGMPQRLSVGNANNVAASYSNDGYWIYYSSDVSGTWEIWKMPAAGGNGEQITHRGGSEAYESRDGQKLYYAKFNGGGIFEIRLDNPAEETLLISEKQFEGFGEWTVGANGIFLAQRIFGNKKKLSEIEFFSFETGKTSLISELDKDFGSYPGIDSSPDGKWLIFSREDRRNHDISLIENFR